MALTQQLIYDYEWTYEKQAESEERSPNKMRSTTLSSNLFRPHSSTLTPKLCFFNNLRRTDRSNNHTHLTSLFNLSRCSELCRATKCEPTAPEFEEFRYLDLENCKETTGPSQSLDGCCASDGSFVNDDLRMECYVPPRDIVSEASFGGSLKFMMLTGLLTFHGSQPALAVPDIASMLQSNPYFGDLDDINTGFASAFLLIFFSELGDKTFFIAALLAARNSAAIVFVGTFGALAAMTVISVVLGRSFHYVDELLPFRFGETDLPVDDIAAVCLLVYFGVSTLLDAGSSDAKAEDEQKEAELAVSEFSGNGAGILAAAGTIASTFFLVFVAEWGDKSFFSTIALAAASSPLGVIGGALAGHGAATLLAVLGGSLLGTFLSEKVIAYTGGVLFLVFAVITLVEIVS